MGDLDGQGGQGVLLGQGRTRPGRSGAHGGVGEAVYEVKNCPGLTGGKKSTGALSKFQNPGKLCQVLRVKILRSPDSLGAALSSAVKRERRSNPARDKKFFFVLYN